VIYFTPVRQAASLAADVHENLKRLERVYVAGFCTDFIPDRKIDVERTNRK
jgi:hypothetical protein